MECPVCHVRTMVREVGETAVYYKCSCGNRVAGMGRDRRISSGGQRGAGKQEKYAMIIDSAPYSRTMLRVNVPCEQCGAPYMTQARVSEDETIIRACDCGNRIRVSN